MSMYFNANTPSLQKLNTNIIAAGGLARVRGARLGTLADPPS